MNERHKTIGIVVALSLLLLGIVLIVIGHGRLSVVAFVAAGIVGGIYGPPTDSSGIHGASDST